MNILRIGTVLAVLLSTAACAQGGKQFAVEYGPAITVNETPMQAVTACVRDQIAGSPRPLRFAVGQVKDYTGKVSFDASEGGYKITQGGALMVMSGLGKIGGPVRQVERFDTSISEMELTFATKQLVRDGNTVRPPTAGQIDGSDYYVVGGITEVNYNIQSGGAELGINQIGGGVRIFVLNVAADLRLVDTKTLSIIQTIPLQKQVVGQEIKANIFSFFGSTLVDFNAGSKNQEPIQLAVRAVLERGVAELVSTAFGKSFEPCQSAAEQYFTPRPRPRPVTKVASTDKR